MKINNSTKFNLKNKIIINIIISILIIGCLAVFIILPTTKNIKKIGNEIENQRIDLETKYIRGQSLKQLNENLKKIEPQLYILDKTFVQQDQELELITAMEKLANKNNITQKINLEINKKNNNENYQQIPLKISTRGNFINLINYIIGLETLNYYININSIQLSSNSSALFKMPDEQTMQNNINAIITANVYLQ